MYVHDVFHRTNILEFNFSKDFCIEIPCISMGGLRIYSAMSSDGGIIDPWYRQEEQRVHMKQDYSTFFVFSTTLKILSIM